MRLNALNRSISRSAGLGLAGVLWFLSSPGYMLAQANTWVAKAPMPTGRDSVAVVAVDGVLYAIGGEVPAAGPNIALNTVEAYSPQTNSWTPRSPMPTARRAIFFACSMLYLRIVTIRFACWPPPARTRRMRFLPRGVLRPRAA